MRRVLLIVCLLAAATAPAALGAGSVPVQPPAVLPDAALHWADLQIESVVAAGLLAPSLDEFRPQDILTRGDLASALASWGHPLSAPQDPSAPVTVRELDARLVAALGLQPAARAIRVAARDAGLEPNPSLGTETVARLLGLRVNHPQAEEQLELLPGQPATRAEAAYSLARAMAVTDAQREQIIDETSTFSFPELTDLQRAVLSRALRLVGDPYVWTGTSEKPQQTLWNGVTAPGGFDCSGFIWRVYKLQQFSAAPTLGDVLQGRTTYAMSGEVAAPQRLAGADLQPADLVFFGAHGPQSKPAEIGHMGIYLGNGWFVHSSSRGVTLDPIAGWYQTSFAWGRSPIAEAGLTA